MLMTKIAPLTVVLYVVVALQPMLAAPVQKEDKDQRSLFASKRLFGYFPILITVVLPKEQTQRTNGKKKGKKNRYMEVRRKGRSFVTGEEESEWGGVALDPITLQENPDRVCADVLQDGPLNEGLPFRRIQHQFQTADENGNGALEKTEVTKFLDKLLMLKFCMDRTA